MVTVFMLEGIPSGVTLVTRSGNQAGRDQGRGQQGLVERESPLKITAIHVGLLRREHLMAAHGMGIAVQECSVIGEHRVSREGLVVAAQCGHGLT
ncbi:MAG: hypothetical protein U1E86_26825 [Burkholderiaceae bacterium]